MKTRLLLVDDDALVLKLYRDGLTQRGFEVDTANDGLVALRSLKANKPDLLVLDLMMPRFNGVDVLRSIRSESGLATLPVIVLSNSYMDHLAQEAANIGVQKALLKVSCRPSLLASVIQEVLAGKPTTEDRSHLLAIPQTPASARPPATKGALPLTPPAAPAAPIGAARSPSAPAPLPMQAPAAPAEAPNAKTRRVLLQQAAASCGALRTHLQALAQAQNDAERATRLQGLYRQVHFVTVAAGMTEAHWLAQMATVFEAMLYEAMDNLTRLTPSALRTMAGTVDFLEVLFQYSRNAEPAPALSAQVLIVDNDPLSNRLVVSALGRAKLRGRSTADSIEALQWLLETRYDLVLLDVEMPGLDAVQLCEQLRTLPGYDQMPVIFLAGQHDFASRAEMAGERQDVISKPVFPMELAVKAVTQLLKNRMRQ